MVIVVPAFADAEDGADGVVHRVIGRLEIAAAKGVADRVDAPGDVVAEEDSHQTTPHQTEASRRPGTNDRTSDAPPGIQQGSRITKM